MIYISFEVALFALALFALASIVISRMFFKKSKPITYYFPDGSHIDPTFNDKFKYLIQHSKRGLYFDNYLICIEHNIMTVYEYIDGDYYMIPEIDRSMVIIHRYLF